MTSLTISRCADGVLTWQVPGRELSVIEQVAPLVRFPLVRVMPPVNALKELYGRSAVFKELMKEATALQVQLSMGTLGEQHLSNFTPKKHKLLLQANEQTVERHKRRKLCVDDKVPRMDMAEVADAFMRL